MVGKYIVDNPQPEECFRAGGVLYRLVRRAPDHSGRWSIARVGHPPDVPSWYYSLDRTWIRLGEIDLEDPNGR